MVDEIITPLKTKILRKKYERQKKLENRANQEYREQIKQLYKHNFKNKKENGVIINYPLLCMQGHSILQEQINTKRIKKEGIKWKYVNLKITLGE